jgi:probable rRNA maturation factor
LIEVRFAKPVGVSAAWVRRVISATLEAEKARADIQVLVTGDREIRKVNRKYLKHDCATDVISFATGDIVISADFAKRYSREHGLAFREEIARYLVHGVLHFLGYDDKKKSDHERMHKRQESLLKRIL